MRHCHGIVSERYNIRDRIWNSVTALVAFSAYTPRRPAVVAAEIMTTASADLEINARKIKRMFFADLHQAQETGKASVRLFSLVRTIGLMIFVDVQANEGVNHLLKTIKDRMQAEYGPEHGFQAMVRIR